MAVEVLLKRIETEPDPAVHTSSHWIRYGKEIGGRLEAIYQPHPITRAFKFLDRFSYRRVTAQYRNYPEVWKAAKQLTRDLSGGLTFNVFKSAAALALLLDHWEEYRLSPRNFLLIGDGPGYLGALLRRFLPATRLYSVDLPRMLLLQAGTHKKADSAVQFSVLPEAARDGVAFVFPEDLEKIAEPIDCAVSMASMQEMPNKSIDAYFRFLRQRGSKNSRFYCVSREKKTLPGGETTEFYSYPWNEKDKIFLDGECPYYTHFFGSPSSARGPRFLGIRIPLINYFDGPMMHRLVRLAPQ